MMAGCSMRLSTPPRLSAKVKSSTDERKVARSLNPPLEKKSYHSPKATHLPRGQSVLRVVL